MKTIQAAELERHLTGDDAPPVINVLDSDTFEDKHIPGSVNIPMESEDFVERVEQRLGGKSQPVVVYCASTQCDASEKAARQLEEAGFTNVQDFESGVEGWEQAGYQLEGRQAGRTAGRSGM